MEYIYYRISCLDPNVTDFYIGSTKHFCNRKSTHKQTCNNECHEGYNRRIYKVIRDNGGWSNWDMCILTKQVFTSKTDAFIYERGLIETHKPTLNTNRPYRSKDEHLEQINQWRDANREHNLEHMRQYSRQRYALKKAQQSSSSESDSSSLS